MVRTLAKIDTFLKLMHKLGASDLHLVAGEKPALRINGDVQWVQDSILDNDHLRAMALEIAPKGKNNTLEKRGDIDFAYEISDLARYRVNIFKQRNGISAVFREIPNTIPKVQQLGLPSVVTNFSMLPHGLVLITGPTGSGKSTTLAAIIDEANRSRKSHIITIEDPIEFVHKSRESIVNQREVGLHTSSFSNALRSILREDPDIILVGEMRDLDTMKLAIEAATTGHLVFATLHTPSAAKTVDRIIEVFPSDEQRQIRSILADGLQAIVAQALFKRIDQKGRCAAFEVLIATPAVRNLIREGKSHQLLSVIQTSK